MSLEFKTKRKCAAAALLANNQSNFNGNCIINENNQWQCHSNSRRQWRISWWNSNYSSNCQLLNWWQSQLHCQRFSRWNSWWHSRWHSQWQSQWNSQWQFQWPLSPLRSTHVISKGNENMTMQTHIFFNSDQKKRSKRQAKRLKTLSVFHLSAEGYKTSVCIQ